jgi:hypothetical protein
MTRANEGEAEGLREAVFERPKGRGRSAMVELGLVVGRKVDETVE